MTKMYVATYKNQLNNNYGSFERSGTIFSTIRRGKSFLHYAINVVAKTLRKPIEKFEKWHKPECFELVRSVPTF